MQQGPVIAMVLEGIEAVELVRKMVGPTEPKSAAPGTIRGDYSHMSYGHASSAQRGVPNVLHASADPEEAQKEIAHWFKANELVEYENVHGHFTQPQV
jgi:nucleoside-diphosphate kinase